MFKCEKTLEIPEISPKNSKSSLKTPKNLPPNFSRRLGGGFTGQGDFRLTPLEHLCYTLSEVYELGHV